MRSVQFSRLLFSMAIFLSISYVLANCYQLVRVSGVLDNLHKVHLPIIAINSSNIHMSEVLQSEFNSLVEERRRSKISELINKREILLVNLNKAEKLVLKLSGNSSFFASRSKLTKLEDEVLELALSGKWNQANQLLNSKEFIEETREFQLSITNLAAKMSIYRESGVIFEKRKVKIAFYSSVACFLLLSVLWVYFFKIYRKNRKKAAQIRKQMEQERSIMNQNAKLASLGEMAAGVGHEINNPLTIIAGLAHLMARNIKEGKIPDQDKIQDFLKKVTENVFRISKIVKSMMTLARDGYKDEKHETAVVDILSNVVTLFRSVLDVKSIKLIESKFDKKLKVKCRESQILQVLVNLFQNAVDAIEDCEEKWISVTVKSGYGVIQIRVTDSGPGLAEGLEYKVLDPFFTTKPIGKGTGLGLSISHSIVVEHGGRLYVDKKAQNTCFVIELLDEIGQESLEKKLAA